ncbi:Stage III sporulation protein AE [anaerobic digester metagenome]|jgi:stage III sporulation protein AE|uniref:stage III sporulation protein AE n=1 Tax=Oscillibacter ruminantium TaxID=1263547 RepID=UPI0003076442|nr:stage III sporulation protein AE [Oscillibacter ruminantium]
MKNWLLALVLALILIAPISAAEVSDELWDALPKGTEDILKNTDLNATDPLGGGVSQILQSLMGQAKSVLCQRLRGAVSILLVVLLCGAVDGFSQTAGGAGPKLVPAAGALSVTLLAAGSLESLIGMGGSVIESLNDFSRVLLPVLAAATAVSGSVTTATVQQVIAVLFTGLLLKLIEGLLMPLVYLYIGTLTAAACLSGGRLGNLAEALRKCITWVLCGSLTAFTLYLSVSHIITGAADAMAVKMAKAAVAGVVPVVGGIIAEAADTVLAGAGILKNTIGVFGTLAVLAACAWPFLHLGIQYLLYKLVGFLTGVVGSPELCKLIDGLGSAFGLVLGMTGASALLLLISILSSVSAVT